MYFSIIMHTCIHSWTFFFFIKKSEDLYKFFCKHQRGMGSVIWRTHGYKFKKPDLEGLRKLAKMLTSPDHFQRRYGHLLSILKTDVDEGLLNTLVQSMIRFTTALPSQTISFPLHWRNILTGSVYPYSTKYPSMALNPVLRSQTLQLLFTLKSST